MAVITLITVIKLVLMGAALARVLMGHTECTVYISFTPHCQPPASADSQWVGEDTNHLGGA